MKKQLLPIYFIASVLISGCKKDEPFKYPEDPISNEIVEINSSVREMRSSEKWLGTSEAYSCFSDTLLSNYARFEFDSAARNGVLRLIPDTSSCIVDAQLYSDFTQSELSEQNLSDLTFEFTFAQASLNIETQMWLSWYYQNLELDINLGPYMYGKQVPGVKFDGVVRVSLEDNLPVVSINGDTIQTAYGNTVMDNHFSLEGKSDENRFGVRMHSENTNEQSLLIFKFLRVFYYGIED